MGRYIIALVALFVFVVPVRSQNPSSTITFEERIHSFGTILEKNGKVSHEFVFHNNGKTPVVINDINSGCGCIGKILSKAPVKPGGKGKVTITFNPEYKSGFFSKEVVVLSNNSTEYNRVWVEGTVTPFEHPVIEDYPYNFGQGLYLRLKVMAFGYLKPGETREMELNYANDTHKEMIVDFKANKTGLKFPNPIKIPAKGKGVINFSYTMPATSKDDAIFTLYPYVNNKKLKETLEVKILNQNNFSKNQKPRPKQ